MIKKLSELSNFIKIGVKIKSSILFIIYLILL